MTHRFFENTDLRLVDGGDWINIQMFERFAFFRELGAEDNEMQVQQATSDSGANAKDILGADIDVAGDQSDKWAGVEVQCDHLDINGGPFQYVSANVSGKVWFVGHRPRGALPIVPGADCAQISYVDG